MVYPETTVAHRLLRIAVGMLHDTARSAPRARVRVIVSPETRHTGLVLFDRYSLDEPVGQGALCAIYRGSDTVLRRSVAVKAVAPELVERYREALAATAALTHPAAVATYDALERDGWLFLVQEYVTGRPLSAYLRDGLPSERAVVLASQVAQAIAYAHAHDIVHGDLTPAAVLVDRQAIARINNFASLPDVAYFERCRREWPADALSEPPEPRSGASGDVQAIGYLLWHILSEPRSGGGLNGSGSACRAFRPDVPESLREGVRRCVVGSRADAILDADTLVAELEALAGVLASARTQALEHTPPALRVAREMIAREAAWSAEETLGGVRYWATDGTSDSSAPSAPTDPMPRKADVWRGMTPPAELTPRLRLPSRPVDDAISTALSDYAAKAAGAPDVPLAASPQPVSALAAPHALGARRGLFGRDVSFALVVALGIALFLLFFIIGYFSSHVFGIG